MRYLEARGSPENLLRRGLDRAFATVLAIVLLEHEDELGFTFWS